MTTNAPKTYFFRETLVLSCKGIVANSFEEAQEQYLDFFAENVKFGKMDADDAKMTCYSIDENGKEVCEY
jgi:hypothetical protein